MPDLKTLKIALDRILASTDSSVNGFVRPVLAEPREGGACRLVSTDGYRMTILETLAIPPPAKAAQWAPRALEALRQLLSAEDRDPDLGCDKSTLVASLPATGCRMLITHQVDPVFPPHWEKLVPRCPFSVELPRLALVKAIKRLPAEVSTPEGEKPVSTIGIVMTALPDGLRVSRGAVGENVAGEWTGPVGDLQIGLSQTYLEQALAGARSKLVKISFTGKEDEPILIEEAGPGPDSWRHILMPMRI